MKENYLRLQTAQTLALAVALMTCAQLGFAQSAREYQLTLPVTSADPVTLDVHLSEGELQIAYGRDGQISIVAIARVPLGTKAGEESLAAPISVEQDGNHVQVRNPSGAGSAADKIRVVCRIDVPYRTEVLINREDMERPNASVRNLRQKVNGGGRHIEARTESGN